MARTHAQAKYPSEMLQRPKIFNKKCDKDTSLSLHVGGAAVVGQSCSSDKSEQSLLPSHFHVSGIQIPLLHLKSPSGHEAVLVQLASSLPSSQSVSPEITQWIALDYSI